MRDVRFCFTGNISQYNFANTINKSIEKSLVKLKITKLVLFISDLQKKLRWRILEFVQEFFQLEQAVKKKETERNKH